MKTITKVQTDDGTIHDSSEAALKHLDARFADALLPLAKKLTACSRYTEVCDVLSNNLNAMREMVRLSDEISAGLATVEDAA